MAVPSVASAKIKRIQKNKLMDKDDLLAVEEPLEVRIGHGPIGSREQQSIYITMRTPGNDFELALGFLYTEGIINSFDQIQNIQYCEDTGKQEEKENIIRVELLPEVTIELSKLQRHFYTTSSCGVCGKSSIDAIRVQNCPLLPDEYPKIKVREIINLSNRLRKSQTVFKYTGGLHAAGLFYPDGQMVTMREDIGRHNALDKLIGACLFKKMIPLNNFIVLVSGRASFELMQKSLMAGIPVLTAVGAPSSLAVQLAKEFNMSLIGFLRDGSFNIYHGIHRVIQ